MRLAEEKSLNAKNLPVREATDVAETPPFVRQVVNEKMDLR